jgi:hypothetical protein
MDIRILYPDFDSEQYIQRNPSLSFLTTEKEKEEHFLRIGRYNGFLYKEVDLPSIHILIPTLGKESLFPQLRKLKAQLHERDFLTIVFDGTEKNIEKVRLVCSSFVCTVRIVVEPRNLGFWGHAIRNKYNDLDGDYVFHIDDDDLILDHTMNTIRHVCRDSRFVYIFKIMLNNGSIIWKKRDVILGEISTQCGVIPTSINKMGYWRLMYGGDFFFYKLLSLKFPFLYIPKLIYQKF